MVVARVAGSSRTRVDGNDIEDRTGGEEGALEGLRLGRGGRELDAGEVFGRETTEAKLRISKKRLMGFDFRKPSNQQNNV